MTSYSSFAAANQALNAELRRIFHGEAGAIRDSKKARGAPGSNLRLLFENREMARTQWEAETFGAKIQIRT